MNIKALALLPLLALPSSAALEPKDLSVEELAGQVFMIAIDTEIAAAREADIRAGRLGGALLRWDKFTGEEAREFSERMQEWTKSAPHPIPFWIAADHEGGPDFTQRRYGLAPFPGNMALGAAGSEALAYRTARASAEGLRSLGVHVDFAPVLDVNTNAENPIIGVRSFGDDPGEVWTLGKAALQGYRDGGLLAAIKHFPGHGSTKQDSHLGLPIDDRPLSEVAKTDLAPFKAAIAAGAEAVMPAHIVFTALGTGATEPVTLSSAAIDGFLRGKLGFKGVTFSDSMDMGAIANAYGSPEASVLGLLAGQDVILLGKADFPSAHKAVVDAVSSGRLPRAKLEKAVSRILAAKRKAGLFKRRAPAPLPPAARARHEELARSAAERAVTLLRDKGLVPLKLKPEETLGLLVFHPARFNAEFELFAAELVKRHPKLAVADIAALNPSTAAVEAALDKMRGASAIVLGTYYSGQPVAPRAQDMIARAVAGPAPAVAVSLMYPYDLRLSTGAAAAVALYGVTRSSLEAGAKLLFGEIKPKGRLPVEIPGLAPRGAGIRR